MAGARSHSSRLAYRSQWHRKAARLCRIGLTVREIGYWLGVLQAAIAYGLKYGDEAI
jgi:hypothetical protein